MGAKRQYVTAEGSSELWAILCDYYRRLERPELQNNGRLHTSKAAREKAGETFDSIGLYDYLTITATL